ncbi:IclR family transcriptional regulator [Brevibacterium oceani]|uniref:IclR family transcriptional regulator n=1 Tax=Brevibacterium oceani TaxID=358099 RepID=UPI0015E672C4|nr:IclR family transcriptional regulator [Brevibacterium oceani]
MAEVPALRRAIGILRHMAASNRAITAGALVRSLEIPRSSAYDILAVLEELGLVARTESGYVLGAGVHELGASYLRTNPLQRLAQPIVRQLAEDTAATAQLAVIRGWETEYVLKEQSLKSVAVITATGVRMPSYLTATGRAILAQLPKSEVLAMLQSETGFVTRTGKGPTSVKALNAVLAQERRVGWAIEHGEVTPGISTIAAPVFDVLGRPIAAVGLSVPDSVKDAGTGSGKDTDKGSGKDSGKDLGKDSDPLAPLVEKVIATAAEVTAKLR